MKHLTIHESHAALNAIKAQLAKPQVALINEDNSIYYEKYVSNVTPLHDYSQDYFTLEAIDNCTFSFTCPSGGIQYSTDNGSTWSEEYGETQVSVSAGDKVLLKGNMTLGETGYSSGYNVITSNGYYNIEGNIFSLYYGDNFTGITDISSYNNCFNNFFVDDKYLVNAEHLSLPATTLANQCYSGMFKNCTSLTTAPKLPATTLTDYCYMEMFLGCTSLTTTPELPATTLATCCYQYMFSGCTSLTTAPELPVTTLTEQCYNQMFSGCTSLTTAPELSATTLAAGCYNQMFSGCTSLNYVKCLATNISAYECIYNWLDNVASTGTFVKAASMTSWSTGIDGIPSGWTIQDAA